MYVEVNYAKKEYSDFLLDGINFSVPKCSIVGIIGENGAGKSTLLKIILGLTSLDGGNVRIMGANDLNKERTVFEKIGVVLDEDYLPNFLTPLNLNDIMKNLYHSWDENAYKQLIERFNIPVNKKTKDMSKGMKMKLSIIVSMSHEAELYVLDEPTTGLDPIAREDLLELFLELKEEGKTILFSSHITTDLEKIADIILFIHNGKQIFYEAKEDILYTADNHNKIGANVHTDKGFSKEIMNNRTLDRVMSNYIKGGE